MSRQYRQAMLDLETWGTRGGNVIRSIGMVIFDPYQGSIGPCFYRNVTEVEQMLNGLSKDLSTMTWWSKQSPESQRLLEDDQVPFLQAMDEFSTFFNRHDLNRIWAQGNNFDPVLLEEACRAFKIDVPWNFRQTRDTRTVYDLSGLDKSTIPNEGVEHYAVDDCIHQIQCVNKSYQMLSLAE